jgi:hypothetical protein
MNSNWTLEYDISTTVSDSNALNNKTWKVPNVNIMACTRGSVTLIVKRVRSNASYNVASKLQRRC